MTPEHRPQSQIRRVISTIFTRNPEGAPRPKCPVCAVPMLKTGDYDFDCPANICPIDSVDFNETIHSYGVKRSVQKDYDHANSKSGY